MPAGIALPPDGKIKTQLMEVFVRASNKRGAITVLRILDCILLKNRPLFIGQVGDNAVYASASCRSASVRRISSFVCRANSPFSKSTALLPWSVDNPAPRPEGKQKHIAMASEHLPEYLRLPLIWSEPFQFFSCAAAAVIEQDREKWTAALRAPEQRM
jgi:hypothetical protein